MRVQLLNLDIIKDPFPIFIRPANKEDLDYIQGQWVRSHQESKLAQTILGESIYLSRWNQVVRTLLNSSEVLVASDPETKEVILGFVVGDSSHRLIHYVFTKPTCRGHGVAKRLTQILIPSPQKGFAYTHRTSDARRYTTEHPDMHLIYDLTRIWL